MSPAPGTRLGAYEILSLLGAGGMGEVYRARDTRLNRDVAIKVLPELFAADADRLARFKREAQVLASLNHPHIAAIYGIEEGASGSALILELVEGPTLADRIAQGPMPIDEALPIARQIAEALEAAHEQGIIHRDLKPANIKLTADGRVKVLDFGLAKATDHGPADGPAKAGPYVPDVSMSPTITSPAMTMGGVILGTAAYMSPEQARGKIVDKRSDIWAFGCVLFEMLTGKRAFEGEDASDVMVAILRDSPDWNAVTGWVSNPIFNVLRRCLEKDPRVRLRDIGEARIAFSSADHNIGPPALRSSFVLRLYQAATVLLTVIVLGGAWWASRLNTDAAGAAPVQRFSIRFPAGARLFLSTITVPIVLSRDGRQLTYTADTEGRPLLFVRQLSKPQGEPLKGTENAARPFFSPDGSHVGFTQRGRLMKINVDGGAPVDLAAASGAATWTDRDEIVFASVPGDGGQARLFIIPAAGGPPRLLPSRPNDPAYAQPHALPGGREILFAMVSSRERGQLAVMSLETGDLRIIEESGQYPHFVSSGHLVFLRSGSLMAAPFDSRTLAVTGPVVPVVEGIQENLFSASSTGLLVYVDTASGYEDGAWTALTWVNRSGSPAPAGGERAPYVYPRIAPDGRRISVGVGGIGDVWVMDLNRGTRVPLTHGDRVQGGSLSAVSTWTPDSKHVTISRSTPSNEYRLERLSADGTGESQTLYSTRDRLAQPGSWSADGRWFVFYKGSTFGTGAERDLHYLDTTTKKVEPLLVTKFREVAPGISPDGRWVAFVTDSAGRSEVYLLRFPELSDLTPVSTSGGTEPVWSRDGRELFYRNGDAMMAVSFSGGTSGPTLGQPRQLFVSSHRRDPSVSGVVPNYDVARDGRFLMVEGPTASNGIDLSVVVNWAEELRRLAPVSP